MLTYWDTCVNVDEDTDIDLSLLVQLDEDSVSVTAEQFQKFVDCNVSDFVAAHEIEIAEFCVFPEFDDCHYAFIYDVAKDIHYLFY